MRKRLLLGVFIFAGALVGCGVVSKSTTPEVSKYAKVTFTVEDSYETHNDSCVYQIIKPADTSQTYYNIEPVREYVGSWWSGSTVFEIDPGSYASMLSNMRSTYRGFSVARGDKITVRYKKYIDHYYQDWNGNEKPIYAWAIDISKN